MLWAIRLTRVFCVQVNGTDFVANGDEARCRFAIRDGRDGSGTERWRYVYTRATIAPAGGSEDESSEMNPPSTLTCDAGTFDASNLKFPVDAVVSVAMFGNDFYDETTVAYGKYVERTVRLRCARGTAGSNCQYTAKTHCNDAGTPNDEGWCVYFCSLTVCPYELCVFQVRLRRRVRREPVR